MTDSKAFKVGKVEANGKSSALQQYRQLIYGNASLWYMVKAELLTLLMGQCPGALGLALRKIFYPGLFKECGRSVIFGRNLTLRHANKISLGDGVILDDNVVLDAKGDSNRGVTIGSKVYIGRNTIVYCKNGDIVIGDQVNISSNCQIFSSNQLEVGPQTVIAAFCYLLSGGQYEMDMPDVPFAEQTGMCTDGPTKIGANCWLATGVVGPDGVTIGDHVVVAAGAVVTKDVAADQLCGGVPAKPLRDLKSSS